MLSINKLFYLILWMFLSIFPLFSMEIVPIASKGLLDLDEWNFDSSINLDGEWMFYPNKFINPNIKQEDWSTNYISVPDDWKNKWAFSFWEPPFGYGSYHLRIKTQIYIEELAIKIMYTATAYSLYANGFLIAQNGIVSISEQGSLPQSLPLVSKPFLPKDGYIDLVVHISNYENRRGGLTQKIKLGKYQNLKKLREFNFSGDIFCSSILLIMALYHLLAYYIGKKDNSTIFFGVTCFIASIRAILTGEKPLIALFPEFPWGLFITMEYLTIPLASWFFGEFLHSMFPKEFSQKFLLFMRVMSVIFTIIILFSPSYIFTRMLSIMEFYLFIIGIAFFFILTSALRNKTEGSLVFLIGFFVLFVSVANDILYSDGLIPTGQITNYGFMLFVTAQSLVIFHRFSKEFKKIENLSLELESLNSKLESTNQAYARFVPKQFLHILGKDNITQLRLGDQLKMEMSILFSDIRGFTKLSEKLTPQQNFEFINQYLKTMTPIITKRDGFVDKYIGDAIMALYPKQPEDALLSAIEMQKELGEFNRWLTQKQIPTIQIGIGIHTGPLMLGVIGSEDRMESTVISDAVNLASRIESLTKVYGTSILISTETLFSLESPEEFVFRILDKVKIKGKSDAIPVVEILDGFPQDIIAKFIETKTIFEMALGHYGENEFLEAKEFFLQVVRKNLYDQAAKLYLKRIDYFLANHIHSVEELEDIKIN